MIQAAKATTHVLLLAAVCLPAFANIPTSSLVAENSHLGSISFALASHRADSVANTLIATGFGGCLYDSGTRPCCSGKERDADTGLDYFGARYMSSAQGRFTSPDKPFADQHLGTPQSWNLYSYTLNNPLRYVDPDGEGVLDIFFGTANAVKSNAVAGLGRESGNSDFRLGQKIGDVISMAGSMVEMAAGGGAATGGGALCLSGVGCLGGAPAIVGGAAIATHGATQFGSAAANFMMSSSVDAPEGSGSDGGNKGPGFVVSRGGDAITVPNGASGPTPVVNAQGKTTGSAYTGGSGGNGLDPKVSGVRIMDPTPARGSSPGYPHGSVTYQNRGGQGVNPQTGRTVSNSDPSRHQQLSPPKTCPGGGSPCP